MGDVMVSVVLEKYGLLPVEDEPPADVLVTVFNEGFSRTRCRDRKPVETSRSAGHSLP